MKLLGLCAAFLLMVSVSADKLQWAPKRPLKEPTVAFLNDFFQPTWITDGEKIAVLPRNFHFGLICAACFDNRKRRAAKLVLSSSQDSSFLIKTHLNRNYWKSGDNYCMMIYSVIHIRKLGDHLTCELTVGLKKYTNDLLIFAPEGEISYIRERVILTNETRLDCKMERDGSSPDRVKPNSTNSTAWWYKPNGKNKIPRSVSTDSSFPGGILIGVGDEIGCATYEMSQNVILRAYEKIFIADKRFYVSNGKNLEKENEKEMKNCSSIFFKESTEKQSYEHRELLTSAARIIFCVVWVLTFITIGILVVNDCRRKRTRNIWKHQLLR